MKISVVGTGYVGLVSGVCLSEVGHTVTCVDVDADKVEQINRGIAPIHEKGLDALLKNNVGKRLKASTNLELAVHNTELSLIAVGTPFDGQQIDLSYIRQVAKDIGIALKTKTGYHVVVVKSTVVPGTTDTVVTPLLESASRKKAGPDFGVGMNPEFLREGDAVADFMSPDRIVLGACDDRSLSVMQKLYAAFDSVDVLSTSSKTAEMIKYTSNSLLATMISFSNEIGNLCKRTGNVDVTEVMQGVHLDKRLSPILDTGQRITPAFTTYIEAGCGFGGSCFPKDVKALISYGKTLGEPMHLLDAVIKINQAQPRQIIHMLSTRFPTVKGRRIAILGLAFKPETDDMRESPAIPVVRTLVEQGAMVSAFDPIARHEATKLFGDTIQYTDTVEDALGNCDAVVLLTRWEVFKNLPRLIQSMQPQPLVIDGRRMLDKTAFEHYEGIGM